MKTTNPIGLGELANGAVILDMLHGVILAVWGNEFVTWTLDADGVGVSCGHYFKTLGDAVRDYEKRTK